MNGCLISPPADNEWTGGHLYNHQMVRHMSVGPPQHRRWRPDELDAGALDIPPTATLLLDSLYLTEVDPHTVQRLRAHRRLLWLIHFLADEAPGELEVEPRERLKKNLVQADGWIATSHFTAERLRARGCPADQIRVVAPGLDARYFSEPPGRATTSHAPLTVLSVAHAERRKGLEELLEVLCALPSDVPDWQWEWIGATSADAEPRIATLRRKAEGAGLSSRMLWRGALSPREVFEAYSRADVFVLLTHYETYGMVFSEALARGVPVIAPGLGEIPRIVEDGCCGLVVPPGDIPATVTALSRLLKDASLRKQMGVAARERAKGFESWAQAALRFSDAWVQLGRR